MRLFHLVRPFSIVVALSAAVGSARPSGSDSTATSARSPIVHDTVRVDDAGRPLPFDVGENLTYRVRVNFLHAGTGSMHIVGAEVVRGHPTYHAVFDIDGGFLFFHAHDHYETWFDTSDMVSIRQTQHIDESSYHADRRYEFYPERKVYMRNGQEEPSVAEPIDETSFIYFLRTIPLQVGRTYQFYRYYHLDRNPVTLTVLRREHIKVPAGEFDAIVVHPTIKSRGIFSEKGATEVWFEADSTRRLLKLKSKLSFGTLYLELKGVQNDSSS
jgi:hypothetical protein